jgi:predicted 2-oxoglutarate/Fe(II)-dependent dioxygenase YbiX
MLEHIKKEKCFSVEECNFIVNKYKKTNWTTHKWTNSKAEYQSPIKNHKELLVAFPKREDGQFIINKIQYFILDYLKQLNLNLSVIKKFSQIRLNKYPKGSSMLSHFDHIHSLFDGKEKGIPIFSVVGLLNDNFKGGEFLICNKDINLKQGEVVVFPSVFLFPHEVKKIIKGDRYSFVVWAY